MATERYISLNEEIQGIEIKTLFVLSLKIMLVNIIWFLIVGAVCVWVFLPWESGF